MITMITLQNATIRHGKKVLLQNVDWTIFHGQRFGVIGANGSGKSTLFSLLLGKHDLDAGNLTLPSKLTLAHVAQETRSEKRSALDYVMDGDTELRALETQLAKAEDADDGIKIAEIHGALYHIDAYTAPTRAAKILTGLGFTHEQHQNLMSEFSGGWRMRLNLAKALMCRSDLLLLDEPTNHLDLDAVLWLEEWLSEYKGTLLLISHDRDFLDKSVDHIAHLSNQTLTSYTGNYSTFEALRASQLLLQQAHYDKQQRELAKMHAFVDRFRYKASKARQAQSRLKAIERMELVCAVQSESEFHFNFKEPSEAGNPLVAINQASAGYGDIEILSHLNLNISPGERIAILGPNGAGKSTLIKLIAGKLAAMQGECVRSSNLKIAYFAQHQVDEMTLDETPIEYFRNIEKRATDLELRSFLGSFGFSGERVHEPIKHFSGGEKSRLALALLVWQKPNLLLLDEPTNHLDLNVRNALSIALQGYEGAMLLVSHDRFLVKTTTDKLFLVANKRLEEFQGDLNDYQKWLIDFRKEQFNSNKTSTKSSAPSKREERQQAAKEREQTHTSTKHLKEMENKLTKLQTKEKQLEETLTDQSLYEEQNKDILKSHLLELSELKKAIEEVEYEYLKALEE